MRTLTFLLAASLFLGLLAIIPGAEAISYTEGFEGFTPFNKPCTPTTNVAPCSATHYAYTETGTGSGYIVSSPAVGTRSMFYSSLKGRFATDRDICSQGLTIRMTPSTNGAIMDGIIISSINDGTPGSSGSAYTLEFANNAGTPTATQARLTYQRTNPSQSGTTLSITFATSIVSGTFYTFSISCPAGGSAGNVVLTSPDAAALGNVAQQQTPINAIANTPVNTTSLILNRASNCSCYYDEIGFGDNGGVAGYRFCSSPGLTNFGYEFKEDVVSDGPREGLTDGTYIFNAGSTNGLALLGKDFLRDASGGETATTSHAFNTTFEIEAATEGKSSDFRVTYGLGTAFSRGNGDTSGSFDNALQARFTENGGAWHIETRKVVSGTISSFGASADQDNPNDQHTYQFIVDTRAASTSIKVLDSTGAIILDNIAYFPVAFNDLLINSQWFTSDGSIGIVTQTGLAKPIQGTNFSTCTYDIEGTSTGLGTPGSIPCVGTGCSSGTSTSSGSITGNIGTAASSLGGVFGGGQQGGAIILMVMYILMFAGFAWGLFGGSPLGIVLGGGLGFVYSVFIGLVPPIITFLLVLAAAAAVGFRFFGGSKTGDGF